MLRLISMFAIAAALVLAWWWPNRPVNPEPGARLDRFASLSFGAFHPGESPLRERFPTAAEADADMALIATRTHAIRTYSAIEGDFDTAALARKYGLKLWQGVWLGGDRVKNRLEIARGIAIARQYPDVVDRVIVGNEVLLRRDLQPDELIADIDQVRAAIHQPVAYADVWNFWEQFPQVAAHVDIMLIHLLPYWEDQPTGIDRAVEHVGAVYDHMVATFPGKRIGIGETGWPSRGRQRQGAVPSRVNEAIFVRRFAELAAAKHFDYNFIEAFDQDWKYHSEGVVGANWGVIDDARAPKFPLRGPVIEDPHWREHAAWSVLLGLGFALAAFAVCKRPPRPVMLAGMAMLLGGGLGYAIVDVLPGLYDVPVCLAAAGNLAGQAVLAGLLLLRVGGRIAPRRRHGVDATRTVRAILRLRRPDLSGAYEDLGFVFLWTASVLQTLLVFDPRYREFPIGSFAVPLIAAIHRLATRDIGGGGGREEVLAGGVLVLGALASAVIEGPLNGQSLVWNAAACVLAAPALLSVRWRRR